MSGTSRNRDEFRRRQRADRDVRSPAPSDLSAAGEVAGYERGRDVGRRQGHAEGWVQGAQDAIDAARRAPLRHRVVGGDGLERSVKADLKQQWQRASRALPPSDRT